MLKKIGKFILGLLIVVIICGALVQLYLLRGTHQRKITTTNTQIHYSGTPTLLVPGWGGNSLSYQKLITTYEKKNIAEKTMTIWVSPSGHIKVKGSPNGHNPMIQLLYSWNYTSGYEQQTRQLNRVLLMLHYDYHVDRMNVIAHSYGGTEFLTAYIQNPRIYKQIRFPKIILLGVPIDETFGSHTRYTRWLYKKSTDRNFIELEKRARNHHYKGVANIYNWMGDSKKGTDGEVPHVQSEMLKSLIDNQNIHYHEHIYKHTNHIQLHQKNNIINDIAKVLWYK